jgi:hypothetical protein
MAFESRVLRKLFNLRNRKKQEDGGNCIMRIFIIFTLHKILA